MWGGGGGRESRRMTLDIIAPCENDEGGGRGGQGERIKANDIGHHWYLLRY